MSTDTHTMSAASDTTSSVSASLTESTASLPDDSTGSRPHLESCLPFHAHGPRDEAFSEGELDVHAGCDGGYLIEHLGETPMTTVDEVNAVRELGGFLLGYPDLQGVGTGLCCRDVTDEACITLYFETDAIDVPDLLDYLRASFADAEGLCFGFRVLLDQAPVTPD